MAETRPTPEELLADGWRLERGRLKAGQPAVEVWSRGDERLEIIDDGQGDG